MGTADRKEAEIPGEEEHPSPGHSLGVSGELEPEDGSSSAPCLLLLQDVQIFHIFCKRAVLDITGSLIRRKPAHCSAFKGKYQGASRCTRTMAEITVLAQLGIASFCLSTSSWLSLRIYINCKSGNGTFYFDLAIIW